MYIKHRVHSYLKVLADYIENLTTKTYGNNSCICAAPSIKLNNYTSKYFIVRWTKSSKSPVSTLAWSFETLNLTTQRYARWYRKFCLSDVLLDCLGIRLYLLQLSFQLLVDILFNYWLMFKVYLEILLHVVCLWNRNKWPWVYLDKDHYRSLYLWCWEKAGIHLMWYMYVYAEYRQVDFLHMY